MDTLFYTYRKEPVVVIGDLTKTKREIEDLIEEDEFEDIGYPWFRLQKEMTGLFPLWTLIENNSIVASSIEPIKLLVPLKRRAKKYGGISDTTISILLEWFTSQ